MRIALLYLTLYFFNLPSLIAQENLAFELYVDTTMDSELQWETKSSNCDYDWISRLTGLSNYCDEPDRNDWELVFEDNFDGPDLDDSKWLSGYGWADYAGESLYLPQNISFSSPGEVHFKMDTGNVVAKGISYLPNTEQIFLYDGAFDNNYREWDCTSAAIRSKRHFMYGKFEIRCWFDEKDYYFPAFWLYGGPSYNEIDIVEFKGQWNNVATNMHHDPTKAKSVESCHGGYNPFFQGSWANGWHRYRCEWDVWKIRYFVDDTPIRTVYRFVDAAFLPITSINQYESAYPFIKYNKAYPQMPMHLIANNTVDDGQGANVSNGKMKIDYIRVWSKNSRYDYLDVDNPNAVYVPDENHHYIPGNGEFKDLVHYVREEENADFVDGQGGDLNGDGIDEFVSLRNFDGHILIHSISEVGGKFRFEEVGRYSSANPNSNWVGLSCGDVDNDGLDEIVAVRNMDGRIFIWDVIQDPLTLNFSIAPKFTYSLASQYSEWRGLECGDFDEDGIDEIALIRNLDQKVFFMKYDVTANNLYSIATYAGFGAESDFVDLTAGDFDGDGKDEVAVLRNLDGNLYILELNSSNQPFVRLAWSDPSYTSDWTSLSSGKYKGSSHHQIVMHRNLDNLLLMVDATTNVVSVAQEIPCKVPVAIGSGFYNEGCENFVVMNTAGDYELKQLLGSCEVPLYLTENDYSASNELSCELSPNPANNFTRTSFDTFVNGKISVYSFDGKLMLTELLNNDESIELNVSSFESGVYTLQIETNHGAKTLKLLKQ